MYPKMKKKAIKFRTNILEQSNYVCFTRSLIYAENLMMNVDRYDTYCTKCIYLKGM